VLEFYHIRPLFSDSGFKSSGTVSVICSGINLLMQSQNLRSNFFIPIIILGVIIIFLFLIFILSREKILGKYFDETTITVALKVREVDTDNISFLNISPPQKATFTVLNEGVVLVSLDYIYIPKNIFLGDNQQLCIEDIKIEDLEYQVPSLQTAKQDLVTSDLPVCISYGKNFILSDSQPQDRLSTTIPTSEVVGIIGYSSFEDPYFFPFDTRQIKFRILLDAYVLHNGEKDVVDTTSIKFDASNPDHRWRLFPVSSGNNVDKSFTLEFNRPVVYPALVIIISIVLLTIVIYHIYAIDIEVEVYWQVIFGLFLGIWSIDQILVPSYINFPTVVTSIILALWLIISISMVYELFIKPRIRKHITSHIYDINELARQIVSRKTKDALLKWSLQKVSDGVPKSDMIKAFEIKLKKTTSQEVKKKIQLIRDQLING